MEDNTKEQEKSNNSNNNEQISRFSLLLNGKSFEKQIEKIKEYHFLQVIINL